MSITSVFQIVQLIIPAIKTAEEFIRGKGRGAEKKEAVLASFSSQISSLLKEFRELKSVDLKDFKWVQFAMQFPVFFQKVGVLIDAMVDLANFIETFDGSPEEPKTETVN